MEQHARRHIKNVHTSLERPTTCDYCHKIYKNSDSLKAHQRSAHGIYQSESRK
jgi:hypothetical protein